MTEPRSDEAIRADRQSRREALDAYFARASGKPGSGLADYIQRLRDGHSAVIDGKGIYRGCACGEVLCGKDLLLAWCDELVASYQAKIGEFAAETLRASDLAARVSELEQERNDLRRVKGTDYEVVAYDGEAHVARHYEATSWDSPPEAELLGSVGDLIRRLDETEARAERAEADRDRLDAALTEVHQRAHLAFQRLGGETLRSITERAWRALAYPDASAAAPSELQETTE